MKTAVCYEPCLHCPFRTDRAAYLSKARAREIMRGLDRDEHFYCHKTVKYGDDEEGEGHATKDSLICAGFAVIAERSGKPTQMMRIAERLGVYDHSKLNMKAPVHKSAASFIKAQL